MIVPKWLSTSLFENALKSYFQSDNFQILSHTTIPAVATGENYTSELFRTQIIYKRKSSEKKKRMSIIVKCSSVPSEETLSFVHETRLFEKEIEMYTYTLPKLHQILGEQWSLSAKCIYATDTPCHIILLEDLSQVDYQVYNRQIGLNLEHCLIIIEKMAKLHASSAVLIDKNPGIFDNYGECLFSKSNFINNWIEIGVDTLSKVCKTLPGYEKYSSKIDSLRETISDKVEEISKRRAEEFNVLNHGDCWINNFMFSYTPQGSLKDFKFIDYQIVIYTNPGIDLQYFWATSPNLEVRSKHLNTVLNHYYTCLTTNLKKWKYPVEKIPSRKQFQKEWEGKALYGLVGAMTVLPFVKSGTRSDASFENLMTVDGKDSFRQHIYNTKQFVEHIKIVLPFMDDLGVFES